MAKNDDSINNEKISQTTVVAQVMDRIKTLITSGLYKPGDRIPTEQELAVRFGIGRSSIREAIKIFQHLGILESRVPKGTFLRPRSQISTEAITWALLLGNDDMWEIIELREVMEQRAFFHLMSRGSAEPEELKRIASELQKEVDTMAKAVAERSMEELIQADYRFHQIIIREGGNKLFFDIFQTLHSFMQEEIRKTFTDLDDLADVTRDHGQILGYIKSGNIEKAVKRHNAHFVRIKKLLTPGAKPTLD